MRCAMTMSKADWDGVARLLANGLIARLDCDGYLLQLVSFPSSTNPLHRKILPCVNGVFKGEWLLNDCEERRRFFPQCKARVWKKGAFVKISKRFLRQQGIDPEETKTYYMPSWNSVNSMKRHLIKNNQNISRVPDEVQEKEGV